MEAQARKTTLTLAGAIVRRSAELLTLARERVEEVTATDILSSACLVTTLLPLMLAHISPLATSDPRVRTVWKEYIDYQVGLIVKIFDLICSMILCLDILNVKPVPLRYTC